MSVYKKADNKIFDPRVSISAMSKQSQTSNKTPSGAAEKFNGKARGSYYNRDIMRGSSTFSRYKQASMFDTYTPEEVPLNLD